MTTNLQLSSMVLNFPTLTLQLHLANPRPTLTTKTKTKIRQSIACHVESNKRCKSAEAIYEPQPNTWEYESLQLLNTDHCGDSIHEIETLVKEMQSILRNEDMDSLSMLELIDDIQRFGLGYRFEEDIKNALEKRLISLQELAHPLHAVAFSFRLLRQHGYHVSQDVFKNLKGRNGNFKAGLEEDVIGMLSLYEASHLGLEGEDLLEEAMTFTRMNLIKKMDEANSKMSKGLAARVSHALEAPLHHRTQREEARWSIEHAYNNIDVDAVKTKYHMLLELAKLDFNIVQLYHQRGLKNVSKWWKELGLGSKLSFARDRPVESFFCAMGIAFEPQHSKCLEGLAKLAALIGTIDDVYDVYGTLDDLQNFTDVMKRWDLNDIGNLPNCMKLCFLAVYNTVNEMAYDCLKEQGQDIAPYLSKAWGDLCESFMQNAKWKSNKEIPRIDEYMENSWLSSSGPLLLIHAHFLMSESVTKESLQCLYDYHHLLRHSALISRLYNDTGNPKVELERDETANSIICYTNEFGVSQELALKKIRDVIEKTWREMNKMNQSDVNDCPFSRKFIEISFNLARAARFTYQRGDAFGSPDSASKNLVHSLIMEPISFSLPQ